MNPLPTFYSALLNAWWLILPLMLPMAYSTDPRDDKV